ncbi:MAG TPA: NADP-dependent oxidoreductase [Chthoniobacterales bacterium]|jgi:NADPH:quinone reductase-like Zn-dependent oxidoreductase|nr:NADP-dependent oxidoreductase [Chthoniobacterales bacterium]
MKAIRIHGSSGKATVSLDGIAIPEAGSGEVLIRVHATAVTPGELEWYPTWHTPKGDPRTYAVPCHEFSGVIEEIDPDIRGWNPGDAVYGLNDWFINGAAAEYCVAKSAEIAKKPTSIDHLHAASVPISGLTAWQGLFDRGKLQPGQKVLIHGGAGGVGSFAIQLAAWKGAFVITTVSEADISFVRELGAREAIDYRKARFEELVTDADLVLDLVGGDTLRASFRAVKLAGRVITIATSSESETDPKFKEAFFIVAANANQLMEITKLIDTGVLRTVVREVLPIDAAAQAYSPTKIKGRGKTVLQVVDSVGK